MLQKIVHVNNILTMHRADYMQGTRLSFKSKEDAIHFAEKQGWDYYVYVPSFSIVPPPILMDSAGRLPK